MVDHLCFGPCDWLPCDSSLQRVPAGREGECEDPRIGLSVTDPQQLLAARNAQVTILKSGR